MATTSSEAINIVSGNAIDDYEKVVGRKIKLEALLTAGCGYGRAKQKVLHAFWNYVWPDLENLGWTKVDGTGKLEGYTYFAPKGVIVNMTRKGHGYYDRIKAVIDRVLERRNEAESKIADRYLEQIHKDEQNDSRPKRTTSSRSSNRIDLSWKDGGTNFPKQTSRVGSEYQATALPKVESSSDVQEVCYEQIWDPVRATAQGALNYIHEFVTPSKREEAIALLHSQNYCTQDLQDRLAEINIEDCSDWSQEEKEKFIIEIFRSRKDFTSVSSALGKSMKVCWIYYLRFFKQSDKYRLLKTIIAEERGDLGGDDNLDACAICGNGGSLLICDGCEGEYHMTCLRPPLLSVPEGHWECDECVDRDFLEAREALIQNTTLYERASKRRCASDKQSDNLVDSGNNKNILLPAPSVLNCVRKLAKEINLILSSTAYNEGVEGSDDGINEVT